mgnify:CR=1 FL=1
MAKPRPVREADGSAAVNLSGWLEPLTEKQLQFRERFSRVSGSGKNVLSGPRAIAVRASLGVDPAWPLSQKATYAAAITAAWGRRAGHLHKQLYEAYPAFAKGLRMLAAIRCCPSAVTYTRKRLPCRFTKLCPNCWARFHPLASARAVQLSISQYGNDRRLQVYLAEQSTQFAPLSCGDSRGAAVPHLLQRLEQAVVTVQSQLDYYRSLIYTAKWGWCIALAPVWPESSSQTFVPIRSKRLTQDVPWELHMRLIGVVDGGRIRREPTSGFNWTVQKLRQADVPPEHRLGPIMRMIGKAYAYPLSYLTGPSHEIAELALALRSAALMKLPTARSIPKLRGGAYGRRNDARTSS